MFLIIELLSNRVGIQVQNLKILTIILHYHLDYYRRFNRMGNTTGRVIGDGYLTIA